MRLDRTLVLVMSLSAILSGCAGMQDQNGGFSIRSVAAGIANSGNPDQESSQKATEQWHSGVQPFRRIEDARSGDPRSKGIQSESPQGRKRTLADLARENGMPPPPVVYSTRVAPSKNKTVKHAGAKRTRIAVQAIGKVGASDMSVIHRSAVPGRSVSGASGDKPIPVDLN